jgi:hypothetical protein
MFMTDPTAGTQRRRRPAINPASIHLILLPDQLGVLDKWIASHPDAPSRPEAIRLLLGKKVLDGN